jgi:nitroreductase
MTPRHSDHPIDPLFLERWSPRAFDGSLVPQRDLETMLEAARWAPSAFNSQPWRFLYAHRGDAHWDRFLELLVPFNQEWARHAAVLVYILSDTLPFADRKTGEPAPSLTHSYDAGAAWALLALQAWRMGYFAHGMSGIELERARTELEVPERYVIEAAAAIGRHGDPAILSEKLRARETPSGRNPLSDIAFHGSFPG